MAYATDRPRVLIIENSISIGHRPYAARARASRAVVLHNPENAGHTRHGLAHLDGWVGTARWDVIVFNLGMHDLEYVRPHGQPARNLAKRARQVPRDEYAANLAQTGQQLVAAGAKVFFPMATPFSDGVTSARNPADVEHNNGLGRETLHPLEIRIVELDARARSQRVERQQPVHVHVRPEGDCLGETVARTIGNAWGPDPQQLDVS